MLRSLSHEFLEELIRFRGVLLAPGKCNPQRKDLRILKVAFREFKKKAGGLRKIIECESSFNGG
tara:strand:- start:243 stop:434 length:192 start_codon:yes stop_codon:yes gene_type:complete